MSKEIKIKMNPIREKVLAVLKEADGEMTLAEISNAAGVEVKTGTTNAMLAAGLIKKVGTKKVAKTVYVEVATYAIGE